MKKLLVCGLVVWMGAVGATESTPAAETPVAKKETPAVVSVIDDRYEILNDGTEIRDLQTTLIWQRCSVGQTWGGTRCEGTSKEFTFDEAQRLSNAEWRVPTPSELTTLIEPNPDPRIRKLNTQAFPGTESWLWTSNTPEPDSLVGSFVNVYNGYTVSALKTSANHVYLMRTNGVRYGN